MQIVAVKSWLLAALSLASPVTSQGKIAQDPLTFGTQHGFVNSSDSALEGAAIVKLWPETPPPTFEWTMKDGVIVRVVYLKDLSAAATPKTIAYGMTTSGDIAMVGSGIPEVARTLNILAFNNKTGGTIQINKSWEIAAWEPVLSVKPLYFEARWSVDGKNGTSYSRLFTLVNSGVPQMIDKAKEYRGFRNDEPFDPNTQADESNPTTTIRGIPTAIAPITVTSTPQPTAGDDTADTPNDNPGQDISGPEPFSSKSKQGLSIGAIIGIAIACGLIGLALIGGFIFCCLRRRQKQSALGGGVSRGGMPYGGSGRNGDELIAEKEANAGIIHDVTSAPHSPYCDDGLNHQHLMGMAGPGASNRNSGSVVIPSIGSGVSAHGVLPGVDARLEGDGGSPVSNAPSHRMQHDHQSGRSYTMNSDHQSWGGGGGSPTTLHSGGGAPSLTHGGAGTESNRGSQISHQQQGRSLSTPYAHLVEEGMTEEEIRRLEEEERQLDAAIEQHAGGRRGSRNI